MHGHRPSVVASEPTIDALRSTIQAATSRPTPGPWALEREDLAIGATSQS